MAPDVPVTVTNQDLRTLARVARIQQVITRNPDKPGRDALEADVANYRSHWSTMFPELRNLVAAQVSAFPDLTTDDVLSAISALEG
jgi:hypothetical protein